MGEPNTYSGAIEEGEKHLKFIKKLKAKSGYYPKIVEEAHDEATYLSSLLRIKGNNGIWYVVHLIESAQLSVGTTKIDLYKKFMVSAYMILFCYNLPECREPDQNQDDEKTRLMKIKPY